MSKRRADGDLNQNARAPEEDAQEVGDISNPAGSWSQNGTATQEQMAGRRIIKAVRRGTKPLEPENAPTSFPPLESSSLASGTGASTPFAFSFLKGGNTETKQAELPSLSFPKLTGAPVVASPFTFDFTPKAKTEAKEAKPASPEKEKEKEPEPKINTNTNTNANTSTADLITPPSAAATSPSGKALTFNFGTADSSVKWPTFEPASLPVFKPNAGLPPFNMSNVSTGKFEINWPTFSPANFNFDKPQKEATTPPKSASSGSIENLEHTNLASSAAQTLQAIDAIKNTPRKTFGQDVDAPTSPVSASSSVRIVDTTPEKPIIEKKENLVTGEENEDVIAKGRVKLFEFEEAAWANKGIGLVKLMKARDTGKHRLVMRVEGAGSVLLNVPIIPNMEANYHQQKNIQFLGVNAKGEGPYKPGNYSLCFSVATDKEEMFKQLKSAIASAKPPSGKSESNDEPKKESQDATVTAEGNTEKK